MPPMKARLSCGKRCWNDPHSHNHQDDTLRAPRPLLVPMARQAFNPARCPDRPWLPGSLAPSICRGDAYHTPAMTAGSVVDLFTDLG